MRRRLVWSAAKFVASAVVVSGAFYFLLDAGLAWGVGAGFAAMALWRVTDLYEASERRQVTSSAALEEFERSSFVRSKEPLLAVIGIGLIGYGAIRRDGEALIIGGGCLLVSLGTAWHRRRRLARLDRERVQAYH
jgi:hypothetical protein